MAGMVLIGNVKGPQGDAADLDNPQDVDKIADAVLEEIGDDFPDLTLVFDNKLI